MAIMAAPRSWSKVTDIEYDFAKTQLAVFFVIFLLAVDSVNPVKIFLHVFPLVAPWHIASLCILLMVYVLISEMKQLLYFSVKIFFHSILSIFFREVSIIGHENIPHHGPVIFTSNHANQFIDSIVIMSTCQRTISYLIAAKSWNRRIIGDLAWAIGAVPVKRSQDSAKIGSGSVSIVKQPESLHHKDEAANYAKLSGKDKKKKELSNLHTFTAVGTNTLFLSEITIGDKIRCLDDNDSVELKVVEICSDKSMVLESPNSDISSSPTSFKIMTRTDQTEVYENVLSKLCGGGTIGIFPEGGSHDRTDLLPLKAGIAHIAYSVMKKHGLNVPIVPVGLNYFRGHRFRGRVIVEFGKPTFIDPKTMADYQKGGDDRWKVCEEILGRVRDNMRGVIVSAPDYDSLQIIHTARRLYQSGIPTSSEKQDLSRRFAEGYKKLLLMTNGNPPQEWLDLQDRIKSYQKDLKELGIGDHQVPGLASAQNESYGDTVLRAIRLPYRMAELLLLVLVSLIPALFLNLPVGLIARLYANKRRKVALASSEVKVKAMDVLLSEKVVICIVLVPSLWIAYGLALYFFTNLDGPAIALAISSMPLFSYMGVVTAEAGMVDLKDLRPIFQQLYPSTRIRLMSLPAVREKLQKDIQEFIRMIGPSLGDLYTEKQLDWAQFLENSRKASISPNNDKGKKE